MIAYWRLIKGCWTWVTTTIKEWAALPHVVHTGVACTTAGAAIIVGGIVIGGALLPAKPTPAVDRVWQPVGGGEVGVVVAMRNAFPGICYRCGEAVETGAGHFEQITAKVRKAEGWTNGKWRVQHADCAILWRGKAAPTQSEARAARHPKKAMP